MEGNKKSIYISFDTAVVQRNTVQRKTDFWTYTAGLTTSLVMALWLIPYASFAQEITSIRVATESWEDNTNEDGTGSFFEMIRGVYALEGISMEYVIVPYERSVEMTRNQEVDAWIAAYDEEEDFALFPEWHFDADNVTAVYKKERFPDFKGIESLEGPVVSWIRGYAYDEYIDVPMNIYRLDKRTSAIEMLVRDRIDVYLDALAEVEVMIEDQDHNRSVGFYEGQYAFDNILQLNLYLGFADNDRGREFRRLWDVNFPLLLQSGEIQRIYNKYDITPLPFDMSQFEQAGGAAN